MTPKKKKGNLKGNCILMSVISGMMFISHFVSDIARMTACHKTAYNKTTSSA
jgi:hypothetical protein